MFESIREPGPSERLRNTALVPLAAFVVAQGYLSMYPMLSRVPAALFWMVVLLLAVAVASASIRIGQLLRRDRRELDARAAGWLLFALATTLLTARQLLTMTVPWL